jgi:hypothetical protein
MSGYGVYSFGSFGRVAGLCIGIQRRLYIFGATQRGIFYRFGAQVFSPKPGYWDTTFAVKTKVWEIDLMLKIGMKDAIIPVKFRPNWIHGALHFSRTGIISFIVTAIDPEKFPKSKGANVEDLATVGSYSDGFYDEDNEKRKQLDSY